LHAIFGDTVGPADHKCEIPPVALPIIQPVGKLLTGKLLAAFVENNDTFRRLYFRKDLLSFGILCRLNIKVLRACRGCNEVQAKLPLPRQSLHIGFECGIDPGRLAITDRYQAYMHGPG